jgi:hypothetical protein
LRTFFISFVVIGAFAGGLVASWWAMNHYLPGSIGTPAHAGAVSQGKPEECTNVSFNVGARSKVERKVMLETGELLRGTFEANGGIGKVDIFLRVRNPQNEEILASPRVQSYDFNFPARNRGEYVFIFDNRFSLFTSKGVGLFYCIERPVRKQPMTP